MREAEDEENISYNFIFDFVIIRGAVGKTILLPKESKSPH